MNLKEMHGGAPKCRNYAWGCIKVHGGALLVQIPQNRRENKEGEERNSWVSRGAEEKASKLSNLRSYLIPREVDRNPRPKEVSFH